MLNLNSSKTVYKFYCKNCDYGSNRKYDYDKHIESIKHNAKTCYENANEKSSIQKRLICSCGKEYRHHSSFSRHKKTCKYMQNSDTINEICEPDTNMHKIIQKIIEPLVEQNKELQTQIQNQQCQNNELMQILKNGTSVTNNVTNNNNTNNSFNLQIFLNEDCKNAINMSDFIKQISVQLSDVERIGNEGYVSGISNLIVKQLKSLDITQRPIHCSDVKRETLYIKDEDRWEKDDDKVKIDNMIKKVTDKNYFKLQDWKIANPGYDDAFSKKSDDYGHIMISSFDGTKENRGKVIKNIAKEVKIDKSLEKSQDKS